MESTLDAYGFKLHQRSLEIRFRIDKKINPFITDGKVHMKCVAQIRHMAAQMRESNHIFYVSSWDDLRNQKLINWKNSGESPATSENPFSQRSCRVLSLLSPETINFTLPRNPFRSDVVI